MKKFYAILVLCLPILVGAQTTHTVTFKVSTANITVGANGIYAGGGILGDAQAVQLDDTDSNGVWTGTATVTGAGGGNFIFLNSPNNGGDWGTKESLGGLPCSDPTNYDDRIFPSFTQDTTLMFCFGTCVNDTVCPTPLTPVNVTFQSDRRNSPAFTDAYLSGTFPVAWNGTAYPMSDDDGDSIYTVVMSLTPGDYRYKFTADNWAIQENFVTANMSDTSCVNTNSAGFTDRFITIGANDTVLPVACWEECGPCSGVGLEENELKFKLYPNPAESVVIIENPSTEKAEVSLFNSLGQKVLKVNSENAKIQLDISELPSGMYYVRICSQSIEESMTITKQ